eukprot:GHVP01062115.1.p1 GENE.GHVP01062115.1~~GHVP01062115.1.p1  ORF type:complete len:1201 (-),score=206.63 GHVP01062115.1:370-3972(-)
MTYFNPGDIKEISIKGNSAAHDLFFIIFESEVTDNNKNNRRYKGEVRIRTQKQYTCKILELYNDPSTGSNTPIEDPHISPFSASFNNQVEDPHISSQPTGSNTPVEPHPINLSSHTTNFSNTPTENRHPIGSLYLETSIDEATRSLLIRTEKMVSNNTKTELCVEFFFTNYKEPFFVTIGPYENIPILFDKGTLIGLKISLRNDSSYKSANIVSIDSLSKRSQKKPFKVLCCNHKNLKTFSFLLTVEKSLNRTSININSPIKITNHLPEVISILLNDSQNSHKSSILPDDTEEVHSLMDSSSITILVDIPAMGLSSYEEAILISQNEIEDDHVFLRCKSNTQIKIGIRKVKKGHIILFPKYLLENNTGMPLLLKKDDETIIKTTIFSFPDAVENVLSFSSNKTKWSPFVLVSQKGTDQKIELEGISEDYTLGIRVLAYKHPETIQIIVNRRYFLINKTDLQVKIVWKRNSTEQSSIIEPGRTRPVDLLFRRLKSCKAIIGLDRNDISEELDLTSAGSVFININNTLLRFRTVLYEDKVFIAIRKAPKNPFLVNNKTRSMFEFYQKNGKKIFFVEPGEKKGFCWEYPARSKKMVLRVGSCEKEIDLFKLGQIVELKFKESGLTATVILRDGVYEVNLKSKFSTVRPDNIVNTIKTRIGLSIRSLIISFANKDNIEELNLVVKELDIKAILSIRDIELEIRLGWLSIEDNIYNASFPYILFFNKSFYSSNQNDLIGDIEMPIWKKELLFYLRRREKTEEKIRTNVRLCYKSSRTSGKLENESSPTYLSTDIKKFSVFLDWGLIERMIELINSLPKSNPKEEDSPSNGITFDSYLLYFRLFEISPVNLNLTLILDRKKELSNPAQLTKATNFISLLGSIDGFPISLNQLVIVEQGLEADIFKTYLSEFYSQKLIRKLISAVGFSEVTGDPAGLFRDVYSGIKDFEGGLVEGGTGLITKTLSGVSTSISKITKSLGRMVSVLTFDPLYLERRSKRRMTYKNKIIFGIIQLVLSILYAIFGLIEKPFTGARNNYFKGFISGIFKGVIGFITKPILGVFDLIYGMSMEIKKGVSESDKVMKRERLPRYLGIDSKLYLYNEIQSIGQCLLRCYYNSGKIIDEDVYLFHEYIEEEDCFLIVSIEIITMIDRNTLDILWGFKRSEISIRMEKELMIIRNIDGTGKHVLVKSTEERERLLKSFGVDFAKG